MSHTSCNDISHDIEVKHKSYDVSYKLSAVEYAEMNSNEKAAKAYKVSIEILYNFSRRPIRIGTVMVQQS